MSDSVLNNSSLFFYFPNIPVGMGGLCMHCFALFSPCVLEPRLFAMISCRDDLVTSPLFLQTVRHRRPLEFLSLHVFYSNFFSARESNYKKAQVVSAGRLQRLEVWERLRGLLY
jgi:hypothetical protein